RTDFRVRPDPSSAGRLCAKHGRLFCMYLRAPFPLALSFLFYIITIMPKKIDHDERRRDIARAAIAVIGEQGIDNTRLVDVARAANATTGTITHYFEDKDAVLLAALDQV